MCRRKSVLWCVESKDRKLVLKEVSSTILGWFPKADGYEPKVWRELKKARKEARNRDGIVCHYEPPKRIVKDVIPF